MDIEDARKLANLARIELSEAELLHMTQELDLILGSVARVSEIAKDDIPPTSHPIEMSNVFRQDIAKPGLSNEEALSAAPAQEEARFKVPQILGEE